MVANARVAKNMKSGVKIWLAVEHTEQEASHSMYLIEPPMDSEEEEMDSDGFALKSISPMKTIKVDPPTLISRCGMFKVGSRFYFLGGISIYDWHPSYFKPPYISDELRLRVQFIDIDDPYNLGFQRVASLNAPKEDPCVFSARGHIYALGSRLKYCDFQGGCGCGIFERYDPAADIWTVLPDPPKPFGEVSDVTWYDSATVVRDRYIFVGNNDQQLYLCFDVQDEKWVSLPRSSSLFPYGSLYVDQSFYYLSGIGSWKPGTQFDTDTVDYCSHRNQLRLVKRGPLPHVDDPIEFINTISFNSSDVQVMSTFEQLDGDTWCTEVDFTQWRDIFHLGDRYFCYVVTTQLMSHSDPPLLSQPYSRGVWIKVFEEVPNSTTNQPCFRTLASFSYRIRTPFPNSGSVIRCSVFGSVPQSWVKSPLKKKQVVTKEIEPLKVEQCQVATREKSDSSLVALVKVPLKKTQVAAKERAALVKAPLKKNQVAAKERAALEGQRDDSLYLAAQEEEYSRLKALLAEKDKLLAEKDKLLKVLGQKPKGVLMMAGHS